VTALRRIYVSSLIVADYVAQAATIKLDTYILRKAVTVLRINNAPTFEDGLYRAVIHPDVEMQLMEDTNWAAVMQYQKAQKGERNELGVWGGCRFAYSTLLPRLSNTAETVNTYDPASGDVRATFVFGKGAFGKVALEGETEPNFTTKQPGFYDAIDSYGTMAWHYWWKVKPLNANWAIMILTFLS